MPSYALITGASSGLGLAMAEALARRGRHLLLVARHRDPLEAVAGELTQRFGVEVLFRACDLGEPLRLSGFLLELEESDRRIDLLVNCAGVRSYGHFLAQEWADEQDLIELNVLALTRLCHALGNRMAVHGGGQILNVASLAAFQPGPWMATYAASKAYVLHFSEALREELKQTGIRVSVLCPGPVTSPLRWVERLRDGRRCLSPEQVALYTVRALARNRAVIIPGQGNRWLARGCRFASRWLARKVAGMINKRYRPRLPQ
ncbi:SDR family oxidoreductase [Pseudomonas sp. HR96]|uniref:SDR family NAD(P)-dependent oxidoreductase n=1 Tax=Pseudomonas sp. HR96 TaxID=1027966 RepID=UPI002A7540D5|nr:SDR family oxidoreductase [Pseudomonas sp. HR96]WPP00390.1 SDR family oxidoreductase [Pseudomonas sp. HR96]